MYTLKFASYCGMVETIDSDSDLGWIRRLAARRIRHARKLDPVVTLERGKRWEFLEPDDCAMVPDSCGELYIVHQTFECRECGSEFETQVEAFGCDCMADDFDQREEDEHNYQLAIRLS